MSQKELSDKALKLKRKLLLPPAAAEYLNVVVGP
jgi:hypothetical protein